MRRRRGRCDADELSPEARALRRKTHQTIAKVTSDFEQLHLNTSVAALMELFNELSDFNADPGNRFDADVFAVREALESLVVMLAPFAPHVAEEMWEASGSRGRLVEVRPLAAWPILNWRAAKSWRFRFR